MPRSISRAGWLLLLFSAPSLGAPVGYVGSAVCARCHAGIAARQSRSNMALTWRGADGGRLLPRPFDKKATEGATEYRLRRTASGGLRWSVQLAGRPLFEAPVETTVGGPRHGVSFLARVDSIGGHKLARAALVETRFLHGAHQPELMLSPGFPLGPQTSYEGAIGNALSPEFEKKCLGCHGQPGEVGKQQQQQEAGVRCEACHGPGAAHASAPKSDAAAAAIVNPKKLSPEAVLNLCGRCHSGFGRKADALPEELLISSQAAALRNTECFKQGGRSLTCTSCHDPHGDASASTVAASNAACLRCHDAAAPAGSKRASICPVNQGGGNHGCVGCHMPRASESGFQMADHWIRAVPGGSGTRASTEERRTEVTPVSAYLRLIVVRDESLAARIASEARGSGDGRFAALAEQHSIDPMASDGGYLGEVKLADLRPELLAAAQRLQYGEVSPVLPMSGGGTFAILARLPRDFRYRAGALQKEADKLRSSGSLSEAMEKSRAALRTYPAFLRALFFLAAGEEQSQNAGESARLLRKAAEFYPEDATAQFNLGVSYASAGRAEQAVSAYKRAIELTPDYPAAYLNLGAALFSLGRVDEAIEAFRAGLRAAPLSAPLYYSLGVALRQSGDEVAAKNALALATAIDREFVLSRDPLPAR